MGLFSKKDKKKEAQATNTPPQVPDSAPSVPGKTPPPPPAAAPAPGAPQVAGPTPPPPPRGTPPPPLGATPPPPGKMPPPPGGAPAKPSFGTPQPSVMGAPNSLDDTPVPERKYDVFKENERYIKYDFSKIKIDKLDLSTNPDVRTIRKHIKKLIEVQKQLITMEKDLTCRKAFLDKLIFEEKEDKKPPILEDLLAGKDVEDNTFTIANKDLIEEERHEKEARAQEAKGARGKDKDKTPREETSVTRMPVEDEISLEGILSK